MDYERFIRNEEEFYESECYAHSSGFGIEDPEDYQVENDLNCEDMPCADGCPLLVSNDKYSEEGYE